MLYVGSEHYGGSLLNLLIAVMVVQMTFIYADDVNIKLTLDLRWKVILGGISALLCIGFAVLLMKSMGPVGLCIGFILGRGLLSIAYPLIVSSIFKISLWSQFKGVMRPLLVMSGVFYACFYAGQKVHVENWLEFIFFSIVSMCIIVPFAFFSGLGPQTRNRLVLRVKKIRFFSAA